MGKKRKYDVNISSLPRKQRKHLREFGEDHPFFDHVSKSEERTQIVELHESSEDESHSDSEGEDEVNLKKPSTYQKLLATLKHVSEDEEESSSDEEEEDDNDEVDEEEINDENEQLSSNEEDEDAEDVDGGDAHEGDVADGEEVDDDKKPIESEEQTPDDFTDKKHEAKFCLETNFSEEEAKDQKDKTTERFTMSLEDPLKKHTEHELEEDDINQISSNSKTSYSLKWPTLGQLVVSSSYKKANPLKLEKVIDQTKLYLHKSLESSWTRVNASFLHGQREPIFTPLQKELFSIMNSYKDLYYPSRMVTAQGEEVRHVYCLHLLNHVLKANSQVLSNNSKKREQNFGSGDEDFRDQGLTRPKVLVVVPFRESALRVVQILISLMEVPKKKVDVSHKKRFKESYGYIANEKPSKLKRPEDFDAIFAGNIDDHFRIGVSLIRKSVRLYAPFYSSDIVIASPLGLRTIVRTEGEKNRDFDFLSSIEMLIIDQADIYLMQNWEHMLNLMSHLNLQPKEPHGVDFSRVRMWCLTNWSKYYRQTLLFSSLQDPQINSIFNKHCFNYSGQVAVRNMPMTGSICQVMVQLPHVFQRLEADDLLSVIDTRFQFFIDKILPQYRDAVMSHTLIYVPSYFDYVRIRNYFTKEDLNFTHICEYTEKGGVSRARHLFVKGDRRFLVVTERFHFYKRYTLKGIKNLIFYELPTYPHFYSEMCNMMKASNTGEEATWTCTVLYSKYDAQKLAAVVGAERAAQMLQSGKNVHLFVTGDNS
ncbi:hypothetical protein GDO81_008771 [Engystomops pustulosus]|uniref:U3 small nucleolar RNA-associated protein 25 homolog n=1 Tax=Engystomops pustulosus TaxID=76066 RepID=A0AAV7CI16_ENGPU|nr:hypothetical protein GDO81_008771 [Engystomops pustulosus]